MAEVELLEDRTQLTPMIYAATDLPLLVPPARPDSTGTVSTIHVADDFVVQDVNVLLNVEHSYVYQLNVVLIAPDGTRVELFTNTSFYWPRKFHCDSVRPASIPIVF